MKRSQRQIELKIPATLFYDEECGYYLSVKEENKLPQCSGMFPQKDTEEEVINSFWEMYSDTVNHFKKRSDELNCWKPFQRGTWKGPATHWVIIFGINIYFRYGKNMKRGWYIPFIKLNILISNHWKQLKKDNEKKI